MGKTIKFDREEPTERAGKGDREGWKADRDASRRLKKLRRGEFVGMRNERAKGGA